MKMNKQLLKKQESIKKKISCAFTDCGQHYTFTALEHEVSIVHNRKKIYSGSCSKCHKAIKLTTNNLLTFQSVFGKANIKILKSSFNDIFVVNIDQ